MISVIIPSYNEEANIARCLLSLQKQTVPRDEYEIIVVDGNSKDQTREIAEKYADLVFIQTSNKVGGARNDGVLRSRGDIIVTTDADCVLPEDWLENIRSEFSKRPIVHSSGPSTRLKEALKTGSRSSSQICLRELATIRVPCITRSVVILHLTGTHSYKLVCTGPLMQVTILKLPGA